MYYKSIYSAAIYVYNWKMILANCSFAMNMINVLCTFYFMKMYETFLLLSEKLVSLFCEKFILFCCVNSFCDLDSRCCNTVCTLCVKIDFQNNLSHNKYMSSSFTDFGVLEIDFGSWVSMTHLKDFRS